MAKHPSYSNIYLDALLESIEEVKRTNKTAGKLLTSYYLGYFCVAEDDGTPLLLVPIGAMQENDARAERTRVLQMIRQLSKNKRTDLSREFGVRMQGGIRAGSLLFGLASGSSGELAEVLMLMVAVKTNTMTKEVARNRLHYFPNRYGNGSSESVWDIE